jgi:hypothetical protein
MAVSPANSSTIPQPLSHDIEMAGFENSDQLQAGAIIDADSQGIPLILTNITDEKVVTNVTNEREETEKKVKKKDKKEENVEQYRPISRRIAAVVGSGVVAGVGINYGIPNVSPYLPPEIIAVIMLIFLAAFDKSGKNFLKSLPSIKNKAITVGAFFVGAAGWDYLSTQITGRNPIEIKSWGLTLLVSLVFFKYLALSAAGYQKPMKEKKEN